jgi:NAD(P)-dependent dehydrogenase (short-subunit alcohol dehydrogenase family)
MDTKEQNPRKKLKDKVIVITGSTRGIGRAIAEVFAEEGAKIVICSRNESVVNEVCEIFTKQGFKVSGISVDVSDQSDLEKLLQHTIKTWDRVDVWINNAGLTGGFRPLEDMNPEEITAIVDVNLTGVLKACRLIIPYFIKQNGGILINLSGKGGRGEASPFLTTYAATKAAVTNLTKSLAKENKEYPLSIHSVVPGMVETDFYNNMKTSPKLDADVRNLPYVLKAFGVPIDVVGRFFVKIIEQVPGRVTGKSYSILRGRRLIRGIGLMMWYRLTRKIESTTY